MTTDNQNGEASSSNERPETESLIQFPTEVINSFEAFRTGASADQVPSRKSPAAPHSSAKAEHTAKKNVRKEREESANARRTKGPAKRGAPQDRSPAQRKSLPYLSIGLMVIVCTAIATTALLHFIRDGNRDVSSVPVAGPEEMARPLPTQAPNHQATENTSTRLAASLPVPAEVAGMPPTINSSDVPAQNDNVGLTGDSGLVCHVFSGKFYWTSHIATKGTYSRTDIVKTLEFPEDLLRKKVVCGMVFQGYIYLPEEGEYIFYLKSDDGSRLYLDGKEVVVNDGAHITREAKGRFSATKGWHSLLLPYFNTGGDLELGLTYTQPGKSQKLQVEGKMLKYTKEQAARHD